MLSALPQMSLVPCAYEQEDIYNHKILNQDLHGLMAANIWLCFDIVLGESAVSLVCLQDKFDFSDTGLQADREKLLLSYGPCQFPTLGLIVQREW